MNMQTPFLGAVVTVVFFASCFLVLRMQVSASISAALWFSALISKLIKWDAWGLTPCFEQFWGPACTASARLVVVKSCGGILLVGFIIIALASTMRMLSIAM
jgi:hypothetical protein